MNWEGVSIVARKELKEIVSNKGNYISILLLPIFFSFIYILRLFSIGEGQALVLDGILLNVSLLIGAFAGFTLCGAVFYREKQSGVIETLLCTPLNIRTIWMGKVMGVTIPAYFLVLVAVGIISIFALISGMVIQPVQPITIVNLALVAPLFTAAAIGLMGYVQLALGMRENRLINFGVFFVLILGLSISSGLVMEDLSLLGPAVTGVFIASAGLLALASYLSGRVKNEKIITTIPD